jgi:hypothetical protein
VGGVTRFLLSENPEAERGIHITQNPVAELSAQAETMPGMLYSASLLKDIVIVNARGLEDYMDPSPSAGSGSGFQK